MIGPHLDVEFTLHFFCSVAPAELLQYRPPSPPPIFAAPSYRQASESALQQQSVGTHLQERSARASLLSLAVAQAYRQGRERLLAARALKTLRDTARARRLASTAAARIKALRLSRAMRVWSGGFRRRSNFRSSVAEKRAAAGGGMSALRLSRCFQSWGEKTRRGRRRRRALSAVAEALSLSRRRAAVGVWRDACRRREASRVLATRCTDHLRVSALRRGLRRWRRETFGGGSWDEGRGSAGEGGGRRNRVLARLDDVATAVDAARGRRRARKALRRWLGHAQGVRRRAEVGRSGVGGGGGGRCFCIFFFVSGGRRWYAKWYMYLLLLIPGSDFIVG